MIGREKLNFDGNQIFYFVFNISLNLSHMYNVSECVCRRIKPTPCLIIVTFLKSFRIHMQEKVSDVEIVVVFGKIMSGSDQKLCGSDTHSTTRLHLFTFTLLPTTKKVTADSFLSYLVLLKFLQSVLARSSVINETTE